MISKKICFSPANGILLVEREIEKGRELIQSCMFQSRERDSISWKRLKNYHLSQNTLSFSPENGILLVESVTGETGKIYVDEFQSRERDSISWKL